MQKTKWTWLGILNYFFLQWFFIRLARIDYSDKRPSTYTIIGPIYPTTGWKSPYVYVWKRKK